MGQYDKFRLDQPIEPNTQYKWTGYVRGVIAIYPRTMSGFTQGADLVITGNVPLSAGLSSSASLEVAIGKFCQQLADLPLTDTDIALIGQKAENQFVGCQCGNMDHRG